MKITVRIKTGKRQRKVIKKDSGEYEVWISARPVKGQANNELLETLADYFGVKIYNISITQGLSSPVKVVEVINKV